MNYSINNYYFYEPLGALLSTLSSSSLLVKLHNIMNIPMRCITGILQSQV